MKGREGFQVCRGAHLDFPFEFRSKLAASEVKKATALAISSGWAIRLGACGLKTKAEPLGRLSRHAADQLAYGHG
jgi:hypothetical protein